MKRKIYFNICCGLTFIGLVFLQVLGACSPALNQYTVLPVSGANAPIDCGPLTVAQENPRYFENGCGVLVYLSGSHTWMNFQDIDDVDPIQSPFDYPAYLDMLNQNGHNFFRLWHWEEARESLSTGEYYWFDPSPFQRPGPGTALDGKPKFDLSLFNQTYFDRMRERVIAAGENGVYVSIMLFNGWSVENKDGIHDPWPGHPFNQANNINDINGDPDQDGRGRETHTLLDPNILAFQEAYVTKVIDTVNDLDNVLYEISNESYWESEEWQYRMIDFIKTYEATQPKQHPVGMTIEYPNGSIEDLYASDADWISPNGDIYDPVATDGAKVVLGDTDHFCGTCGDVAWVWRSLTRGYNPILMDPYEFPFEGTADDPIWDPIRRNLGYALGYANRMNLAAMTPLNALCSSTFCLANSASDGTAEFLVFIPGNGYVTVDLSDVVGEAFVEWLDPATGQIYPADSVVGGNPLQFTAPFPGESVLYLSQVESTPTSTPTSSLTPTLSQTPPTATQTSTPTATVLTVTPTLQTGTPATPTSTPTPTSSPPTFYRYLPYIFMLN